ncbi:MAG TPA: dihydrodipicolinate reductase C-terminal domain-containing protein [Vicinamibacterales bacterium]|nr:dihydrodipicolinate reductase C-terminal domain-containing protein [Vicinamibacterales bacterium]
MLRILLVGHGRMGQLVERLASAHACEVAGIVSSRSGPGAIRSGHFGPVDVAIDFTQPSAVAENFHQLAERKINVVVGTTGWQRDEAALREIAIRDGIGVLASANFSIAMAVFRTVVQDAARRFGPLSDIGAWIHESHHAAKKDAPSGTALMLKTAMEHAGYPRPVDVSSTRAGSIPGTHVVGFDAAAETMTLVHEVRDRAVFAHGALQAAAWLKGRQGWFSMDNMLENLKSGI